MHPDRHEEETRPRAQPPRRGGARPTAPTPAGPLPAAATPHAWVTAVQRTAGNRAATGALAGLVPVQRVDPAPAPAPTSSPEGAPGREPRPDEVTELRALLPGLTEFRILREPAGYYNCFAWAVGIDSGFVGSRSGDGYKDDSVESWTDWLKKTHGFTRSVDGFDPTPTCCCSGRRPGGSSTPPARPIARSRRSRSPASSAAATPSPR